LQLKRRNFKVEKRSGKFEALPGRSNSKRKKNFSSIATRIEAFSQYGRE
jgi:hypothetical protein